MSSLLWLVVVVLLVVALAALPLAVARRRRGPDLEPPPPPPEVNRGRPSAGTRPSSPRPGTGRPRAPAPPDRQAGTGAAAPQASPVGPSSVDVTPGLDAEIEAVPAGVTAAPVKPRFRDRIGKARALFTGFLGRTTIDAETWDDLEEALIRADVGVRLTSRLLDDLRTQVKADGIATSAELVEALKRELKGALEAGDRSLRIDPGATNVWLFVGVNGVGKTTTIGKIGAREVSGGRQVVMAAGDTFRAAAAEQLGLWSTRVGADLVRGTEGGDPGAVIFDAVQRAAAKGADLVLADTAGRLHTKVNLMEELRKVRRVAARPPGTVSEVLLVIDATTGQNGLEQARQFAEAVEVTGVVLTKLDGTAKGGIALAIQSELGIPIKLVGLGETADDLTEFDPGEFVDALLET